jgi:succinate dehydrogenase/fumarate reductase flavoprotein subunit
MDTNTNTGFIATIVLGIALVLGLLFGFALGCPAYNRYQARANANNKVKISAIEIRNQDQRVKVAEQQAQIRYQNAVGIKKAQDEIQKTLTPLYVQFEMVDALKTIATSGSNNSVVYIPVGANGIPLISGAGPQVKLPDGSK